MKSSECKFCRVFRRGSKWYSDIRFSRKERRVIRVIPSALTQGDALLALSRMVEDEQLIRRGRLDRLDNSADVAGLVEGFLLQHAGTCYSTARFYAEALGHTVGAFKMRKALPDGAEHEALVTWPPRDQTTPADLDDMAKSFHRGELDVDRVDEITADRVEKYLRRKSKELQASTLRHRLVALKALLTWATESGRIKTNPVAKVKPPALSSSHAVAMEVPQYEALVAASAEPWQTLWVALATTGMRIGEALKLKWSEVNWPTRTVRILAQNAKSRKQRDVPLLPDAYERLRALLGRERSRLGGEPSGYVFGTSSGGPRRNNVRRAFVRYAKTAGIEEDSGVTIHSLRHMFATTLLMSGVNPKVVSTALGHANIQITLNVYAHALPSDVEKAVNALPYGGGTGARGTPVVQGQKSNPQVVAG